MLGKEIRIALSGSDADVLGHLGCLHTRFVREKEMATITMIKKGGYLEKLAPDRGIHLYSAKERFCCLDSNGNLKYFEKNSSDMEEKGKFVMIH